ncbi:hypothetical protein EJ05DRAFT_173364 [Pseudovirgaria hyperparasitica]|uniref:BRCT domain-containing protein n=1 Tax=Pseudovirgaria hyperparasitica TaxID=470096 RepID=A0A6A6VVL0_9PEZI|nr:uncharacterized protein EJ05DRAFT_173364 [Pseudovirgaria hyperparasitica]KAF2753826.1 hypothetical protein EJ05DRAFT_173364 [Pseudovirgaria hyperparasitica]
MPSNPSRPSHNPTTKAAQPTRRFFDPWNSSSTGHQRAENVLSGSTSWRDSRNRKLAEQYRGGYGGGTRVADSVGAGSPDFGKDGRKPNGGWEKGRAPREPGQKAIMDVGQWGLKVAKVGAQSKDKSKSLDENASWESPFVEKSQYSDAGDDMSIPPPSAQSSEHTDHPEKPEASTQPKPQIFTNLTFYINGSTGPYISDHKLRYLLSEHGASTSIALARRQVTHVILGTPSIHSMKSGAGGGLASSKIQKEIQRVRGKGVKYISAEWVVESIKAGKRLPETRFARNAGVDIGKAKGQGSVFDMLQHG